MLLSALESDDDDDACFKILIITLIRSALVIHSSRNQGGDSRGKGIMTDAAVAPPIGNSRLRPSSGPASSFQDISGDAIHRDFFPFSPGPYFDIYLEGSVVGNWEMVWIKALSSDQLTAKLSVLHFLMMSHGGELLARYRGLLQSYQEYVESTDSRLKGYQEKFASLTGLESQVSGLNRQVAGLNDKLSSSDAAFSKSKAKGKERKKKIKSLTKSLDNLHAEVARLSADLNRATVLEAEKDEEIIHLKATPLEVQAELLSLAASAGFEHRLSMHQTKEEFAVVLKKVSYSSANVPALRDARFSPPLVKELTMTPASKSLEFPTNVIPASSTATLEPNEEWVNAMVDGPNHEMTYGAVNTNSGSVFVHGASYAIDDAAELTLTGSERVSPSPSDVVVALSAREKGDGSLPSSTADEEAAATPFGF
ncbi:hypothetical protein Tco_1291563 [Tanacetum coccineum]